ncbi:MAG: ACP S-malonyltransferase, partial [Vicinamibacterales bacterium]
GSQYVGMGKALADRFPVCRQAFEEADDALGRKISHLCFDGPAEELQLTENTQPAILTMSVAVCRLLRSRGYEAQYMAGHSLGEYSAHVAAGTLGFADALRLVSRRGRYMQEAVPVGQGAMAVVIGLNQEGIVQACAEVAGEQVVSAANLNTPNQIAISGHAQAVERAGVKAKELGAKRVIPLSVSAPFHCALMKPAEVRLEPELRGLVVRDPSVPVVANIDATPKQTGKESIEALISQVSLPVLWEASVRTLVDKGVSTFLEVGPGRVLTGLIKKTDRSVRVLNVEDSDSLGSFEAAWESFSNQSE